MCSLSVVANACTSATATSYLWYNPIKPLNACLELWQYNPAPTAPLPNP